MSGNAVTGIDGSSTNIDTPTPTETDAFPTETTDGSIFGTTTMTGNFVSDPTIVSISGGSSKKKETGKVSISLIIGIVVGFLFFLFIIGALIIFLCVKKKKQRQLKANQQAIAAAQASRPQSQYPLQMQQQPTMPDQIVQPQHGDCFRTGEPQKINLQTQVNEYPMLNPPTPAPPYVQPYHTAPANTRPIPGTYAVDTIYVPNGPGQLGPVYEMGYGR